MKDSSKENLVALMSRKEAINHIGDSDKTDQGEETDEDFTEELVVSAALIVKRYEESKENRSRRAQFKGSSSTK